MTLLIHLCLDQTAFAIFFARCLLGILFIFQGIDAVFNIGVGKVAMVYKQELGNIKLPNWLIYTGAYFTSFVQLFGGACLIVGIGTAAIYPLLAVDLLIACVGFSLINPMWDMRFVFPRLILLLLLMLLPMHSDLYSFDHFLCSFL